MGIRRRRGTEPPPARPPLPSHRLLGVLAVANIVIVGTDSSAPGVAWTTEHPNGMNTCANRIRDSLSTREARLSTAPQNGPSASLHNNNTITLGNPHARQR